MSTLIKNELPLKRFTFSKEKRHLVCVASDLPGGDMQSHNPRTGLPSFIYQIHDDACDLGISIMSEVTGKTEVFYFEEGIGHSDDFFNGYRLYSFRPVGGPLKNVDQVIIFND